MAAITNVLFTANYAIMVNGTFLQGLSMTDLNTKYVVMVVPGVIRNQQDVEIPVFTVYYRRPHASKVDEYVFPTNGATLDAFQTFLNLYVNTMKKYTDLYSVNITNILPAVKDILVNTERINKDLYIPAVGAETQDYTNLYVDKSNEHDVTILTVKGNQSDAGEQYAEIYG